MPSDAVVRPGDELPQLSATLVDNAGAPVDLTGATVRLKLRGADVVFPEVSLVATIAGGPGGVRFPWTGGGLPTVAGRYFAHWRVTYPSGDDETFPNATNGSLIELIN